MAKRISSKASSTVASLKKYAAKNAKQVKSIQQRHAHHHAMNSVRTAEHKGHTITIKTTYEITVDGQLIHGHLGVDNAGQVHYHPIPNVAFDSAIDLVKRIIDVYPDDFASDHDHSEHDHHEHAHAARRRSTPSRKTRPAKTKPRK